MKSNFLSVSAALAISDDGLVIVGKGETDAGNEAFIWDRFNGMRSLLGVLSVDHGIDLTGWQLSEATDVSSDGRVVVGTGVNPSGFDEAWRVTLPAIPLPALAWTGLSLLALLGSIALAGGTGRTQGRQSGCKAPGRRGGHGCAVMHLRTRRGH